MVTENEYAELGLAPGATEREVKAAWRRLVSQWHPDRNPSDAALGRMQRINQAFETIRLSGFPSVCAPAESAPRAPRRERSASPPAASSRAAPPASAPAPAPEASPEPDDDAAAAARVVHRRVRLTLEEAALGCTKELRGKSTDPCGVCHGAGHRVLAKACPGCRGSGRRRNAGWFGWGASETGCEACGGSGRAQEPCAPCDGAGKLAPRAWRVSVRIPPGARDGDPLRVPAAGRRSGSGAGPMNLRVSVAPHPIFSLEDDGTLRCELPVDGFAWAAQRPIEVPTIGGLRPMSVPRDQLELRLRGEGFPSERRGPRADLVVRIVPVFPPRLSTDQEILIDQLVAASRRDEGADGRIAAWHRTLRQWERSRVAET